MKPSWVSFHAIQRMAYLAIAGRIALPSSLPLPEEFYSRRLCKWHLALVAHSKPPLSAPPFLRGAGGDIGRIIVDNCYITWYNSLVDLSISFTKAAVSVTKMAVFVAPNQTLVQFFHTDFSMSKCLKV